MQKTAEEAQPLLHRNRAETLTGLCAFRPTGQVKQQKITVVDHKRVLVQTKSLTNRGENYSKDRTQRRDSECRWRKKQKPEDATKEMKCSVNVTYWWVKRSSCKISTVSSAFRLKRRDEGRGARLQNPSRGENQLLQRVCATKASSNVCRGHRHTAASPHYYRHVWLKTWCRADPLHAGPCPSLPGHRVLLWGKLVE